MMRARHTELIAAAVFSLSASAAKSGPELEVLLSGQPKPVALAVLHCRDELRRCAAAGTGDCLPQLDRCLAGVAEQLDEKAVDRSLASRDRHASRIPASRR